MSHKGSRLRSDKSSLPTLRALCGLSFALFLSLFLPPSASSLSVSRFLYPCLHSPCLFLPPYIPLFTLHSFPLCLSPCLSLCLSVSPCLLICPYLPLSVCLCPSSAIDVFLPASRSFPVWPHAPSPGSHSASPSCSRRSTSTEGGRYRL